MQNTPKLGQKLLIIGGCGGIGRAVVKMALEQGLEVAVFDLPQSIEKHPPPENVLVFGIDATQERELKGAFSDLLKKWEQLDFLVNLVGFIAAFKKLEDLSVEEWKETMDGNLKSLFLCCKTAIPYLAKGGAIVNMSSGLALIGRPNYAPYSAAKAAILSLTKTLAAELAPDIRVNAVAPGAVQTDFLTGGLGRSQTEQRVDLEFYKKLVPLQTIAQAEEIAAPILFLLSEGARHITGQTLHVNGGGLMI
ncbi:MAG: SDR family oxidoreductase [Bacteroidota bacterium]